MSTENKSVSISDQHVKQLLENVAEEEGFCQYTVEKCGDGSVKGDGYIGIITSVRIVGKDKTNQDKVLNLVVKSASKGDPLRKQTSIPALFDREIYIYSTVLPALRKFEAGKGLTPSHFAPKFYKGHVENKSETLILENLKENGYKLHERRTPMNDDHVSFVMSQYGRFHAFSFALRDQNLDEFKTTIAVMDDVFSTLNKSANFVKMFSDRCRKVQQSLHSTSSKEAVKVFETFINNIEPFCEELLVDDYSVVLHGDCWITNMLFKYSDKTNPSRPTDMRFIDFQLARLGSPVLDLSYFFYTCSSKEIISKLDHYLNVYYSSLSSHLLKLGSDASKLFPYSVLQQHWKRYARYGLLLAECVIYIMLSEENEMVDLSDVAESGEKVGEAFSYEIANIDAYNDRIIHIVRHFIENNFI